MAEGQRLHPLSFLFIVGANLRSLAVPALFVLLAARGGSSTWQLWALWLAIPYTLYSLYRWATFRYLYARNELVIRTGVLFRNERHILYSRIQNIETIQNPLHRVLKVVEVRVQTAGGQEPEAKIQVLSSAAAEEMRRRVVEAKRAAGLSAGPELRRAQAASTEPAATADQVLDDAPLERAQDVPFAAAARAGAAHRGSPGPERERTVVRLSIRELMIFGLVDNRGLLVATAAFGLIWEANVFDVDAFSGSGLLEWAQGTLGVVSLDQGLALANVVTALGMLLLFILLVRMLSIGWAIFKLHGFTLTLTSAELKTSCGWLTQVRSTVPRHRIQVLSISESPLQRLFRRVGVLVETAGGDQGASDARHWLAPILPRDQVAGILKEVDADIDIDRVTWQRAHPRAWFRMFRRFLWIVLLLTTASVWAWGPWGLLVAVPAVTVAWVAARGRASRIGFAFSPELVYVRDGWLWRHLSVARLGKIQSATMTRSPFDRRWSMAHVAADTAGGGLYGVKRNRLQLEYLELESARAMYDRLAAGAGESEFSW